MAAVTTRFVALVTRLFLFPKPVVAAAAGPALAGGFMLYCASDHRIAGPTARFALTEVAAGIPVLGPTAAVVTAALAPADHAAVLLHGQVLDADAAAARGLVHERAPDAAAVEAAALDAAARRVPRDRAAYHVTKLALRRPLVDAAAATAAALAPALPRGNVFRVPKP
jgi:enoyl-CoA hydratase/carnithine racemase